MDKGEANLDPQVTIRALQPGQGTGARRASHSCSLPPSPPPSPFGITDGAGRRAEAPAAPKLASFSQSLPLQLTAAGLLCHLL